MELLRYENGHLLSSLLPILRFTIFGVINSLMLIVNTDAFFMLSI